MSYKKKGFTLLEATVVIIIIAILASIGAAQYYKVLKTARKSSAMSLAKEIGKALQLYYQINGSYYGSSFNGSVVSLLNLDLDNDGNPDVEVKLKVKYGPKNGMFYYAFYEGSSQIIEIWNYSKGGRVLTYNYINDFWNIFENNL